MYGGGGGGCWSVHFLRYWIVICKKQLKRKKNLYEIYVKHKETTGSRCQNNPLYFGALSYSPASFLAQQQRLLCSFAGKKSQNANHPNYQTEESEVTTHWDALKKELVRNKMNSFSDCGSYVELNVSCRCVLRYNIMRKLVCCRVVLFVQITREGEVYLVSKK